MCFCCCPRLHRHQIHLISYGFVSLSLITTGLVFTVFAIFQKDSQIGKVWLAGPCAMVVGLVLCGKVIIDWGPAMLHGRQGSIDSTFVEQFQLGLPNGDTKFASLPRTPIILENTKQQYFQYNGDLIPMPSHPSATLNTSLSPQQYAAINHYNTMQRHQDNNLQLTANTPHTQINKVAQVRMQNLSPKMMKNDVDMNGMEGAIDCIVYAQFDSASDSNASSYTALPTEIPNNTTDHSLTNSGSQSTVIVNSNCMQNSAYQQFPRHKRRISAPAQSQNLTLQSLAQTPPHHAEYTPIMSQQQPECNCVHQMSNRCNASPRLTPTSLHQQHQMSSNSQNRSTTNHQDYGSIGETKSPQQQQQASHLYQGETFTINERSYFI